MLILASYVENSMWFRNADKEKQLDNGQRLLLLRFKLFSLITLITLITLILTTLFAIYIVSTLAICIISICSFIY